MQPYTRIEISVGAFVLAGALALAYLSFTLGGLRWTERHYKLHSRFAAIGELKVGDPVKLAGVPVGEVAGISLVNFAAEIDLLLDDDVALPDDTIASIQSAGLLGDSYVALSPGAADRTLVSGSRITRTEAAVSLTELIAKYAFGSPLGDETPESAPAKPATDELE